MYWPSLAAAGEEAKVHMARLNVPSLAKKTFALRDFYNSHALEFMFLTETWMCEGEVATLTELCPPNTSSALPDCLKQQGAWLPFIMMVLNANRS